MSAVPSLAQPATIIFGFTRSILHNVYDFNDSLNSLQSLHQDRYVDMNQAMREYLQGVNATSFYDVEHENRYFVDESGRRF